MLYVMDLQQVRGMLQCLRLALCPRQATVTGPTFSHNPGGYICTIYRCSYVTGYFLYLPGMYKEGKYRSGEEKLRGDWSRLEV